MANPSRNSLHNTGKQSHDRIDVRWTMERLINFCRRNVIAVFGFCVSFGHDGVMPTGRGCGWGMSTRQYRRRQQHLCAPQLT
mmetsp:Transcript_375/g.654  ORF Transcript_375/g.654 Transcript_375/m.654 type:complete len:82 (+) Transcript_375:265-510(+)